MEYNINLDNPLFFTLENYSVDNSPEYSVSLPDDWYEVSNDSEWKVQYQVDKDTERQGWKVHVSSNLHDSHKVLFLTAKICHLLGVSFKYLSTEKKFVLRNSKLVDRGFSGKFITCYPDQSVLEKFLNKLELILENFSGPYILNDKRWKKAPIYLRYGVFRQSIPGKEPNLKLDELLVSNKIVKDVRGPEFIVPEGLELPGFLRNWLKGASSSTRSDLPFTIDSVIKFSNVGGVYKARLKKNNQKMILREARPYTGLDFNEVYATDRLESEEKALKLLSELQQVPEVIWSAQLWEHKFLGVQYMDGIPLNRWVTRNYPIYREADDEKTYLFRIREIIKQIVSIVKESHLKGVYHQDIHVANVLVDDNDRVSLVDWEQAVFQNNDEVKHQIAAPGFTAWEETRPSDIDWYGVKQLAHYLFLPLIIQSDLVYNYERQTRRVAHEIFKELSYSKSDIESMENLLDVLNKKVPRVRVLSDKKIVKPFYASELNIENNHVQQTVFSLMRGIELISDRWQKVSNHRIFPVHYYGLTMNQGIAFSDLGIIWSISKISSLIETNNWSGYEELKYKIIMKSISSFDDSGSFGGLFDGIAGSIWLIYELGEEEKARQLFSRYIESLLENASSKSLYNGTAGILLVGLYLVAKSKENFENIEIKNYILKSLYDFAMEYIKSPQDFCKVGISNEQSNDPYKNEAGLLYGHAGFAWLFGEAYRFTSNQIFEDCLNLAIKTELEGYGYDKGGALQYQQGHRMLPYLSNGSAGLLLVISRNKNFVNSNFLSNLDALKKAIISNICIYPGLFNGFSGLELSKHLYSDSFDIAEAQKKLIKGLYPYFIRIERGLALAGDNGLKITTDVASGFGGIALALVSLQNNKLELLPSL